MQVHRDVAHANVLHATATVWTEVVYLVDLVYGTFFRHFVLLAKFMQVLAIALIA